jgi:hypothetical protein
MNWRIKLVIAAFLIAGTACVFLVRNLMLSGWKDLHSIFPMVLSVVVLLFSSAALLLRGARKNSK